MYSVRMRRLSDRARLEGMLALRKALETVRRVQPRGPGLALAAEPPADDPKWWQRSDDARDAQRTLASLPDAPLGARGLGLARALDRIADSIDRVAAQVDAYHVERAAHLDAIEFLLREIAIGSVPPSSASSVVLGGVVEPDEVTTDDISIVPDGKLENGTSVEVRSRFHDRWISGFAIAEAVDEPNRLRYRLTRRSDGIPLPILFDACDVRSTVASVRAGTPTASRSSTRTRP